MVVLLVIDMQVGLFSESTPRYDAEGVVERINKAARWVREAGGAVIFVQHYEDDGGVFARGAPGWQILPALERTQEDLAVEKQACDSFYRTNLSEVLNKLGATTLIIGGCATDFCVDTTVRAAASRDYQVLVMEDGHTTADRPHLDAKSIIRHHNWMWRNLILPDGEVQVLPADQVIELIT